MNRFFSRVLIVVLILSILPIRTLAATEVATFTTLDEILIACNIDKSEFSQIEVKYTSGSYRSVQDSFAFI